MTLDLSFKQLCDLIKKDEPKLIDAVDKLLGFALICAPIVISPKTAALLPTLAVKNELVKLGKWAFDILSKKKDDDYVIKQQRMQMVYGLICFTSFFEALDRLIPEQLRQKIDLLKDEKVFLAKSTLRKTTRASKATSDDPTAVAVQNPLVALAMPFPHPTETLAQQLERHTQLWKQMAQGFYQFVQKLAFWEEAKEKEQAQILAPLDKIPEVAAECFQAQYFELARRYEDFAVWANLQEHKETKELIGSLSVYVQQQAALTKSSKNTIDIGFAKLHSTVISIPETLKISQATEIVESLTRHYNARIAEPIAEEKDEPQADKPRLSFPRVSDAFIPQSFRVLCQTDKTRRLEDEATWKNLDRRDDLGAFLLSYLSSPYSTEMPLIILGHPGSGKSLLTTVLSAQLMSKQYMPIRVPLREVDAEAGIVAQIEERIRRITNISVDSWAKLSGAFKNSPPIVILDGYDELLQASGKVFSGYLKDVQNFQKSEAEQERPVRVIVTSRITLIDKATIPLGSTIIRLLEFDKRQRDRWISIWNRENANYFKKAKIKEFALPKENDDSASKVLSLAEQPLLLLMLALYDSQNNQLRKSKALDRTILYDSLLRRFVDRERAKEREFNELGESERKKELDFEMQRLAVAALGMYNRRKLHILSPELNEDIKFFSLERPVAVTSGKPLTQADLLLGSFFFVHKSKAQHKAGAIEHHEETAAFEFLHNTFGEFLTAEFILRQALAEVEALKALKESEVLRAQLEQRLGAADGLSRAWFASLVYTPLFTRPVVLEMMREWIVHVLKRRQLSKQEFLSHLDTIIINQVKRLLSKREMPSIIRKETAQEGYRAPFGDHPLLGHIAIYSINLILLRAIVDSEPFIFEESQIGTHEDGARPWDRLTHIWRAWFALDNLNGVTAVMLADRKESQISIRSKDRFQVTESQSRLETCLNVGVSLGDNISSGLTGLLLFEPSKQNRLELEDIALRLEAEKIDLEFQVTMKRILQDERGISNGTEMKFLSAVRHAFEIALHSNKYEELEHIALSLRRGIRMLRQVMPSERLIQFFRNATHPKTALYVAEQNPHAALILCQLAHEIGDFRWRADFIEGLSEVIFHRRRLHELAERNPEGALGWVHLVRELRAARFLERRGQQFFAEVFDPRYLLELAERNPEAALSWLQLAREVGAGGFLERHGEEFFERIIHPRYLLELTERNPEAALSWVQLAQEMGAGRFLERYGEEFFKQIIHPRDLLELAERNPEAALSWIQLAREVDAGHFLERYGEEFFKQITHPRYITELVERNPEAARAWIQLAREVGARRFLERHNEEFFEQVIHPRDLLELAERNPEAALSWIQLAREVDAGHFLERYGKEFFERIIHPRYLLELIERNPEATLVLLQLVREAGAGYSFERVGEELFHRVFSPSYLTGLFYRKPVAFAATLRLARESRSRRAVDAVLKCLTSFLRRSKADRSLFSTLPLSALADLRWLAHTTASIELNETLSRLFDADGHNQTHA